MSRRPADKIRQSQDAVDARKVNGSETTSDVEATSSNPSGGSTASKERGRARPQRSFVDGSININVLLSFLVGILLATVILVFSVAFPNPSDFQLKVWITFLAIASGGLGAVLPGFLDVRYKTIVRAGGALGLIVLVLIYHSVIEKKFAKWEIPKGDSEVVAKTFLRQLDDGQYRQAYEGLDDESKNKLVNSLDTFQSLAAANRMPHGNPESRTLVGIDMYEFPPGYPAGIYRVLGYKTKFSKDVKCRAENIVLRAGQDLQWHVYIYNIAQQTTEC